MKISQTIMQREILHNKEFPMNSIILELNNKNLLVCPNPLYSYKQQLELYVWISNERKWVKTYAKNKYTQIILEYYNKNQRKSRRKNKMNYSQLMQPGEKGKSTKINPGGKRKRKDISKSVVWSAKHPFQGGGFSPK